MEKARGDVMAEVPRIKTFFFVKMHDTNIFCDVDEMLWIWSIKLVIALYNGKHLLHVVLGKECHVYNKTPRCSIKIISLQADFGIMMVMFSVR